MKAAFFRIRGALGLAALLLAGMIHAQAQQPQRALTQIPDCS
jgi:hypothetical protein